MRLTQRPRADRAFERLYRKHAADVYRYSLAVLRSPDDAEDVTQTTFMNAYRAYQRGERPNAPRNWLIAIAHNVCRQRFRQSARRPNEVALDEELTRGGARAARARARRRSAARSAISPSTSGPRSSCASSRAVPTRRSPRSSTPPSAPSRRCSSVPGALCASSSRSRSRCPEAEHRDLAPARRPAVPAERAACARTCASAPSARRSLARQRAQRSALKSLGAVPLPASLGSFFGGGGGAAIGGGIAAKAVLAGAAAASLPASASRGSATTCGPRS